MSSNDHESVPRTARELVDTQDLQGTTNALERMENNLVWFTFWHFQGHKKKTAAALGVCYRTLQTLLSRHYNGAPFVPTMPRKDKDKQELKTNALE